MQLQIDTKNAVPSIRIGFTDQRLTAHGGLMVWLHFLRAQKFRQQLRAVLPHDPTTPNACDPTDVALGYVGGMLCGADKLSRVAWLQSDAAVAAVPGVEAIASQSTLSRFFGVFTQKSCQVLGGLHFGDTSVQDTCEQLGLKFIFVAQLTQKIQSLCRHDDAAWQDTEVAGLAVQEVELERSGRRLIVIRQQVQDRPQAGGKTLLELEGYRFQALVTNLPANVDALTGWRRYNGGRQTHAQAGRAGCRQP